MSVWFAEFMDWQLNFLVVLPFHRPESGSVSETPLQGISIGAAKDVSW